MPQLDFSYYISQITWLLLTFGGFFFISKFVILPKLDKVLNNRTHLIDENTKFAKEQLEKIKKINFEYDAKIASKQEEINRFISDNISRIKLSNNDKIETLKKQMLLEENENIIQTQNELKDIQNKINNQIVDIIADAIEKIFLKKIDKEYIRSVYIKYL